MCEAFESIKLFCTILGGLIVRVLGLRSEGHGFGSQLGHSRCQVVTPWMGDCQWAGKPFSNITNTKINSAFHPFR